MSQEDEVRLFVEESILLPRQQVGVEEIREIELIPHISVFEEREKVLIDGILLCRGRYHGRERTPFSEQTMVESRQGLFSPSFQAGELLHEIPVQIEIAKERITDIEKVYVKIDSFDYDVVDPYQLLITAELCIEGVRGAQKAEQKVEQKVEQGEAFTPNPAPPFNWEVWEQWNEEKLLRIAAADDPLREEPEEKNKAQSGSTPLFRFHESMQWNLPHEERLKVEKQEGKRIEQQEERVNTDPLEDEQVKEALTEQNSEEINKETSEKRNKEFDNEVISTVEEDAQENQDTAVEESESTQVARPNHEKDDENEAHLSSFLPKEDETTEKAATDELEETVSKQTEALGIESSQEKELDQAEVEVEVEAEAVHVEVGTPVEEEQEQVEEVVKEFKVTIGKRALDEERNTTEAIQEGMDSELDAVVEVNESPEKELRYYLYPDKEDGPSFTKVKLCIVQREETLFEIAQRYDMTPKQLMEFNQLASAELAEGQLLYIPTLI